jgi:hypothetical protein
MIAPMTSIATPALSGLFAVRISSITWFDMIPQYRFCARCAAA